MEALKFVLFLAFGAVVSSSDESKKPSGNTTQTPVNGRSGRENYDVSPPDDYIQQIASPSTFSTPYDANSFQSATDPRRSADETAAQVPTPEFSPPDYDQYVPIGYYKSSPRYYSSKSLHKSGSNTNWNVWKGEIPAPAPPKPPMPMPIPAPKIPPHHDFEEYYYADDAWKGDPWTPDKMATMMMMMPPMKPKIGGFLSGLTKEPLAMLLAAILPLCLILSAIMPTLINMMMNGGLPTITTTATGNKGRSLEGDESLPPIIKAINTLGDRVLDHPGCIQRIFCEVTKGTGIEDTDSRPLQRALYKASTFVDDSFLKSYGVKDLFDSMSDGHCEKISCPNKSNWTKDQSSKKRELKM